ncbi:hypothetical protein H5410_050062 [Solanum commersonii]|uniref:Uncharacterized protein n=1 Tax=Solanum commersonii TaxID=4109 RepID=A0A9J5WUA1_SOLCO|nr:hypothetical protein H5410_050062 [Solanum commersonii]
MHEPSCFDYSVIFVLFGLQQPKSLGENERRLFLTWFTMLAIIIFYTLKIQDEILQPCLSKYNDFDISLALDDKTPPLHGLTTDQDNKRSLTRHLGLALNILIEK